MQKITKFFFIIALGGFVFYSGITIGLQYSGNNLVTMASEHPKISSEDFSLFWKALSVLESRHPNALDVTSEELVWNSIVGLTASFNDPYTTFFKPEESAAFEESLSGEFSGIGMEVGIRDGFITVIAPLRNSPAEKAGLLSGDIITKINDLDALEMSLDSAVKNIRGPQGTEVFLTIAREGEGDFLEKIIVRDVIEIPSLETEILEGREFLIRIDSFIDGVETKFEAALKEFKESESEKLILDLRNNPGGFLSSAINISSWFVPQGSPILIESFGPNSDREDVVYRSKGFTFETPENFSMVVLVNGGSASASEIVAGALREYDIATLVGTKTFGKGSVQEYVPLDKKTSLKVTVANWLTPNRESFSNVGLEPDIIVEQDRSAQEDVQLLKALEILNQ